MGGGGGRVGGMEDELKECFGVSELGRLGPGVCMDCGVFLCF